MRCAAGDSPVAPIGSARAAQAQRGVRKWRLQCCNEDAGRRPVGIRGALPQRSRHAFALCKRARAGPCAACAVRSSATSRGGRGARDGPTVTARRGRDCSLRSGPTLVRRTSSMSAIRLRMRLASGKSSLALWGHGGRRGPESKVALAGEAPGKLADGLQDSAGRRGRGKAWRRGADCRCSCTSFHWCQKLAGQRAGCAHAQELLGDLNVVERQM
jgi:hypothetical protein